MANKKNPINEIVHCRYSKCAKLHESNELNRDEALRDDNGRYYHPDCHHMMRTINEIRDLFCKEINPVMTSQQIGALVSTIHNLVFTKKVDVDFLKFALMYFIKSKPGKLHQPYGLHYIVQDRDVVSAWDKEQKRKIKVELKDKLNDSTVEEFEMDIDSLLNRDRVVYKPQAARSFADILR